MNKTAAKKPSKKKKKPIERVKENTGTIWKDYPYATGAMVLSGFILGVLTNWL